jgi:hypothetical protein
MVTGSQQKNAVSDEKKTSFSHMIHDAVCGSSSSSTGSFHARRTEMEHGQKLLMEENYLQVECNLPRRG